MELNKNIIIISDDNNKLILKIGNSDKLIKLSKIEFEIIENFIKYKDKDVVINNFVKIIKIDNITLNLLIDKAIENKIIIDNYPNKPFSFLNIKFKRNKRIFEILDLDFTSTIFEKLIEKRFFLNSVLFLIIIYSFVLIFEITREPLNFRDHYNKTLYAVPISFTSLISFIYFSSFSSIFFHEVGHYFFYKYFRGKTSMFGFGLLFFFLPVFYNRIIISFIKKRNEKILVNLGGIIFDFIFFLSLIVFTKYFYEKLPILSFLCYTSMISICIRSVFNLNVFLPNTDGYFILSDVINKPNLFEYSIQKTKELYKTKRVSLNNLLSFIYLILSYLSIIISWLFFFFPFIIYFYYALSK